MLGTPAHQLQTLCYANDSPGHGQTLLSYHCLIKDPATAETWMTAFGKDFGGMSQGDNKRGQKGMNAMFVVLPADIPNIPEDRTVTYAWVVVDHCPQKEDTNQIRIMTGVNLMNYPGELTTIMADITTFKLHWNGMLSTQNTKYMCLDIKKIYLSSPLDQYEYM